MALGHKLVDGESLRAICADPAHDVKVDVVKNEDGTVKNVTIDVSHTHRGYPRTNKELREQLYKLQVKMAASRPKQKPQPQPA